MYNDYYVLGRVYHLSNNDVRLEEQKIAEQRKAQQKLGEAITLRTLDNKAEE